MARPEPTSRTTTTVWPRRPGLGQHVAEQRAGGLGLDAGQAEREQDGVLHQRIRPQDRERADDDGDHGSAPPR